MSSTSINKADALQDIKRYDGTIDYYDKNLSQNPSHVYALNGKAFTLANLGKNEEALPLIKRVLESNSGNENYLCTATLIIYNLDKYDEAKSYYDKAMKINANLTSILTEKELTVFNKLMINNNTTKE